MQKDGDPGRQPGKRLASGKQDKPPKEPKPKKPGRLTRQQKFLIALAAVLAWVWWALCLQSLLVRQVSAAEKELPSRGPGHGGRRWLRRSTGVRGPARSEGGGAKSEDYYTVLILGRVTGSGGNTDPCCWQLRLTNQKATVMSSPGHHGQRARESRRSTFYIYYGEETGDPVPL
jgi:hypothetical protein